MQILNKISLLCFIAATVFFAATPSLAFATGPDRSYEDSVEFFQPFDSSAAEIVTSPGIDPTLQGKGTWAYQFTYIDAEGSATDLAQYRAQEKIKPASVLKLFTGWMAYETEAQPVDYLGYMLRRSDNDRADSTLKKMGGAKALVAFYQKWNLPLDAKNFTMVDGSGLSHSNQVTSELVNQLLLQIFLSGKYDAFKMLLAQPGEDGTLISRLKDADYPVHAKTGTLADTASLAGYVDLNHGTLIFSILSNQLKVSVANARVLIDNMVRKYIKKAEAL